MTTLEAFGFNLAAGLGLACISLIWFGAAVVNQSDYVAPRCSARPRNVIYNPYVAGTNHDQDRGNIFFGWIPWTLGLSYDTLLNGVPGTGTRQGGKAGMLLKANLDSIVLLRFHALGLKLSALGTVLFLLILLPMYYTAGCAENAFTSPEWEQSCATSVYNLTNYERTTIANVPSSFQSNSTSVDFQQENAEVTIRLYFVVMTFWILHWYLIYLLQREWIEISAMRRVYYLEADVWRDRKQELCEIELFDKSSQRIQSRRENNVGISVDGLPTTQASKTSLLAASFMDPDEARLERRDPWLPHPEHRETVPNIQLYSVMVGSLPSMPEEEGIDPNSPTFKRKTMDWQMELTADFFDRCIPNQPGFSSSVVAVTVLPSSRAVSTAWRKWYTAAKKLRRLRFIRAQLARKYREEMAPSARETDEVQAPIHPYPKRTRVFSERDSSASRSTASCYKDAEQFPEASNLAGELSGSEVDASAYQNASEELPAKPLSDIGKGYGEELDLESPPLVSPFKSEDNTFRSSQGGMGYYDQLLSCRGLGVVLPAQGAGGGFDRDNASDVSSIEREIQQENQLLATFGPEQIAVYSREFAQSASACCPNGCCERAVENSTLEELHEMERTAMNEVDHANAELFEVQRQAKQLLCSYNTGGVPSYGDDEEGDESSSSSQKRGLSESDSADQIKIGGSSSTATGSSLRERRKSRSNSDESGGEFEADTEDRIGDDETSCDSGYTLNPFGSYNTRKTKWEKVLSIVSSANMDTFGRDKPVISGEWTFPTFRTLIGTTRETAEETPHFAKQTMDLIDFSRESTYAVVTFTSRQAAVAARQCLADARSAERWLLTHELPIPPLADAAAWDLCACRNCCRPVTLSIDDRQKSKRWYIVFLILAAFYVLSPALLALFSSLLQPAYLEGAFPNAFKWLEDVFGDSITGIVSGFLQSTLYTAYFTLLPMLFQALSNFGSNAYSVANAELSAIKYFWWFMVMSAFSGVLIANMVLFGFSDGVQGGDLTSVLLAIARSIPSTQAATWLNWIILRTTYILTSQYLLQMPSFLFAFAGMKCCSRLYQGGGPGPATPYRLYVDSGMVLLSLIALAPCSPLVAPGAFFYFLYAQPILRRCVIFVYRPRFDSGGLRWPFLFQLSIACLIVGQILLTLQMMLKQATGPTVLAAVPILLSVYRYHDMKNRYTKPFLDAALLQTSLLDGWDDSKASTKEKREEFRKFLVDSHKAAYVPVCLAGSDNKDKAFTAEPAMVVDVETDLVKDLLVGQVVGSVPHNPLFFSHKSSDGKAEDGPQFGAVIRRGVKKLEALDRVKEMVHNVTSMRGQPLDTLAEEAEETGVERENSKRL